MNEATGEVRSKRIGTFRPTPVQSGMLFDSIEDRSTGVDVEQIVVGLPESIDATALSQAWQFVTQRHEALRSSFRWTSLDSPVLDVWDVLDVHLSQEDWRNTPAVNQPERLEQFLRADRSAGFALDRAPLFRLVLCRTGEATSTFIWTVHHAIVDGRSFVIVLRDVFARYDELVGRARHEWSPPGRFSDHLTYLAKRDFLAPDHWRDRFGDCRSPTPLPAALPPRGERSAREVAGSLTRAITRALDSLADRIGVTLTTLVQGAWAIALARHAGEPDVVFGATRACRRSTIAGADETAGLFINTLPLRVAVDLDAPLIPWLRALRDQWTALRAWEHTPLSTVQAHSGMPPGTPMFESIVVYEHRSLQSTLQALGGAWGERSVALREQPRFPLTLAAYGDSELCLKLLFNTASHDGGSASCVLGHVISVLEGMAAANSGTTIGDLSLIGVLERAELLRSIEPPIRPPKYEARTLGELFTLQVARAPEAVAVMYRDERLSYRELDRRSNQLANRLRTIGVAPNVGVGLCLERSIDLVVAILAVLKAGGYYVPLDPQYPAQRLAMILADASPAVVVTTSAASVHIPDIAVVQVMLDRDADALSAFPAHAPLPQASGSDLAYVIYTSGSTGKPKGVMVTHHNVLRLLYVTEAEFGFDSSDVWTLFHSYAFDFSVWELWGALGYGGSLVVVPHWVSRSPEEFHALVRDCAVTVLCQTPSAFRGFVSADSGAEALNALRVVIFGGEALEPRSLAGWFDRYGDERPRLANMYGLTETTVHTTLYWLTEADAAAAGSPIGRPLADLKTYVLETHGALAPIGVAGELHIGGAGLALGYLNRPELTAERFISDPFSSEGRLYRSGDRVRRLCDGSLQFLGRTDDQVKIRGFRIEPGEVEAALLAQPGVGQAAVIARADAPGGEARLVAYLVPAANAHVDCEAIRLGLSLELPAHLIPAHLVVLAALPLTSNGKLDRARLPDPGGDLLKAARAHVAPRDVVEEQLVKIWQTALRRERVGVNDDFFSLGGDSIVAIAVVSRARAAGLRVSPKAIFEHPTIAKLARIASPTRTPVSDNLPVTGLTPLTPAQRWFFSLDAPAYWNQAFLFAVPPGLDHTALGRAIDEVVDHHDALRARFNREGDCWQAEFVGSGEHASLEYIDLSSLPAQALPARIEGVCTRVQASFDLARGPLIRVVHFALGTGRDRLFVAVHHLAVDGVSWRILVEDIETAYSQAERGRAIELPPKTSSVQHWAQTVEEYARSSELTSQRGYWRTLGAHRSQLPGPAVSHGADVEADAETFVVRLDAEETRRLIFRTPFALRAGINDVLLAGFGRALHAWLGDGDFLIDAEGHGREDLFPGIDLSRTVGWFTSIFPVLLELTADALDALRTTKERLRTMPDRGFGYGILRYVTGDPALQGPHPQVAFNYLGQFDDVVGASKLMEFASEPVGGWHDPRAVRRYRLEVVALVRNGCFEANWSFNGRIDDRSTIARVAERFIETLRTFIAASVETDPRAYVPSDFPLARLDRTRLALLVGAHRQVEDIYPLSAMQGLFYAVAGGADDVGVEQWRYRLSGSLDTRALRAAWQSVIDRHAILRTAFVSAGLSEPLQLVRRHAELIWAEHDLRGLSGGERDDRLAHLLAADRTAGFELERPPLMRIMLLRLTDATTELVWTHHHLLLDRWSWPIVLQEVGVYYRAETTSSPAALPVPVGFADFMRWSANQQADDAEVFWRTALAECSPKAAFAQPLHGPQVAPEQLEVHLSLSVAETSALREFAIVSGLAPNTVVLAAWSLWLAHHLDVTDAVVGIAVSGRAADLIDVERIVGVLINNLPLRVRIDPEAGTTAWLRSLQTSVNEIQRFAATPLASIQSWSGVPWQHRLFDTLVVFQHACADSDTRAWLGSDVEIDALPAAARSGYPFALLVTGDEALRLRIAYDQRYVARGTAATALERVRDLIGAFTGSAQRLGDVLACLPRGDRGSGSASLPAAHEHGAPLVGARTTVERAISGIWCELLGVESIDVHANFFAIGGQSLLAMRLVSRLVDIFGVEVTVRTVFNGPTVAELAEALQKLERSAGNIERIAELVVRVDEMSLEELELAATVTERVHP